MGIRQLETTQRPSERPGVPCISIRRDTGLVMRRAQSGRRPRFGDNLPGRPSHTATIEIPKTQRKIKTLYKKYYEILAKLRYGEAMSLCRGLRARGFKYSYSTYLMRRYGHRQARLQEVIAVVDWFKAGKPTTINKRKLTIASLFLTSNASGNARSYVK